MKKRFLIIVPIILLLTIALLLGFFWPRFNPPLPKPPDAGFIEESIKQEAVGYQGSSFKTVSTHLYGDWMIATIESTDVETELANVVFKKSDDEWVIVDGPGTDFDETFLKEEGAPEELIKAVNNIPSPTLAP